MSTVSSSTDERGRIYLPKHVRDRFGEDYRIVELPSHVVLLPIDEDPMAGVHEAIGDAFQGKSREEMKTGALENASDEVEAQLEVREQHREEK